MGFEALLGASMSVIEGIFNRVCKVKKSTIIKTLGAMI